MHDRPRRHTASRVRTTALACLLIRPSSCAYQQARAKCGAGGCAGDAQIASEVQALFRQHSEFGTQLDVKTPDGVV